MSKGKYRQKRLRQQRKLTMIYESGLSERVIRVLSAHGINTLYELDKTPDEILRSMPRIGTKAMAEIHAVQLRTAPENAWPGTAERNLS